MSKKNKLSYIINFLSISAGLLFLYFYGNNHNWALTTILIIIPLICGAFIAVFSHISLHDLIKKVTDSLLTGFSLISYSYYIYSVSHINSTLTFAQIFSSPWGYLFLSIISLCGVIKLLMGIKDILSEYKKAQQASTDSMNKADAGDLEADDFFEQKTSISIIMRGSHDLNASIEKHKKIQVSIKK